MLDTRLLRRPHVRRRRSAGRAHRLHGFPLAFRAGSAVIAAGLLLDVGAHAGWFASAGVALLAHWLVLGGMVLALAGVVLFAVRQRGG